MSDGNNPIGSDVLSRFDVVVMLTWSNWKTEPRSNRYHYATRFARHLPVLFVQPDHEGEGHALEDTEIGGVRLLHVTDDYSREGALAVDRAIKALGFKRPLYWVYNPYFHQLVELSSTSFTVYHATENYFAGSDKLSVISAVQREQVGKILAASDLVVAVSEGVANDFREVGGYKGRIAVVPNGCDYEFWTADGPASFALPASGRPVAFYQGGINWRLDFELMGQIADAMPDWDFWYCGRIAYNALGWPAVQERPNVRYLGELSPEEIRDLQREVSVGLIPFLDDPLIRKSWPLKAFEYVAGGLPVISAPVQAFDEFPDLFRQPVGAEAWVAAIREVASTRADPAALARRLDSARAQSYERRFADVIKAIGAALPSDLASRKFNVLVFYDDRWTHVMTVGEHVGSFGKYSKNNVFYVPATLDYEFSYPDRIPPAWDLSFFDVVIVHYAVRLIFEDYFLGTMAKALASYTGLKMLFIQDEYDNTEQARTWFDRLNFDVVFTCVPPEGQDYVYPKKRFPGTDFVQTLTGYVPEDNAVESFATPLAKREMRIGYRGRQLAHHYGTLGHEKYRIGVDVRRLAEERGVPVDIEVAAEKRIYGDDWYRFLGSCRATLGTESGSNVFDFDGSLARLSAETQDLPYEEAFEKHFAQHEGKVRMNQISPKIFEAIRLRTALILFEGSYSGVVEANTHYIPLKKDYSNIDEVLARLEDLDFLQQLTERAYQDIIASGKYTYRGFAQGVDQEIDKRILGEPRAEIISVPLLRRRKGETAYELVPYEQPFEFALNTGTLQQGFRRGELAGLVASRPGIPLLPQPVPPEDVSEPATAEHGAAVQAEPVSAEPQPVEAAQAELHHPEAVEVGPAADGFAEPRIGAGEGAVGPTPALEVHLAADHVSEDSGTAQALATVSGERPVAAAASAEDHQDLAQAHAAAAVPDDAPPSGPAPAPGVSTPQHASNGNGQLGTLARAWRILPLPARLAIASALRNRMSRHEATGRGGVARMVWRMIPPETRARVAERLRTLK